MATLKIWQVKNNLKRVLNYDANEKKTRLREDYSDLTRVIDYARNKDKTEQELFVAGINCLPETAADQFIQVKKKFRKTGGVLAYHGYFSFRGNEATPEEALAIGKDFVRSVWGDRFQALVTVHLNTENIHCHFCINSVSFVDGKKLVDKDKYWNYLKHRADEVCRAYGKSVIEEKEHTKTSDDKTTDTEAPRTKGRRTTARDARAKKTLDKALDKVKSLDELKKLFELNGIEYDFSPAHRYWTFKLPDWEKPYRTERLNKVFACEGYSKDEILAKLDANSKSFKKNSDERKASPEASKPAKTEISKNETSDDDFLKQFQPVRYTQKNDFYTRQQKQGVYIKRTYEKISVLSFRRLYGTPFTIPVQRYRTIAHVNVMPARPKKIDKKVKNETRALQERCNVLIKYDVRTEEDLVRVYQAIIALKKRLFDEEKVLKEKLRGPADEERLKEIKIQTRDLYKEEKALREMQFELNLSEKNRPDDRHNNDGDRSERSR